MTAALKGRIVSALLLVLILAPPASTGSAASRSAAATASQNGVAIPQCEFHLLSRREIFQAIQNHLAQMGISGRGELRSGDLNIQSSVPVLIMDMGLMVKKIRFNPLRRETVFELWASHEPQYLPFEVTTRRDPQTFGLASEVGWRPTETGRGKQTESPETGHEGRSGRSKPPVLAKPGTPATLIMFGQNVRVTTTVNPLQPGSKGQRILVRDTTTARVLKAEVVDEGLLQTNF
jgi:hypothetical protein